MPDAIDLSKLSLTELETLVPRVEKELATRRESAKREALEKMRKIAEGVGMTPEELLGLKAAPSGRRRRGGGGRRGAIAWRHPDKPDLVYQGGRKPAWLKELEAAGREAVRVGE